MKIAACSITNAQTSSQARTLFTSLTKNAPAMDPVLLICERPETKQTLPEFQDLAGVRVLTLDQIGADHWKQMAFGYTAVEFATSLKPFLMRYLLKSGYEAVIFFDPELEVLSPITELAQELVGFDALVTPKVSSSEMPAETIIRQGQFDLSFFALKKSAEVLNFLDWWAEKLREKCLLDSDHRYYLDEFWAELIVSFISSLKVIHHRTCVSRKGARPTTVKSSGPVYSFSTYKGGPVITDSDRRKYHYLSAAQKDSLGDPFENPQSIAKIRAVIGRKFDLERSYLELNVAQNEIKSIRDELGSAKEEVAKLQAAQTECKQKIQALTHSNVALHLETQSLRSGISWKIGRAVTWPLRRVRSLF